MAALPQGVCLEPMREADLDGVLAIERGAFRSPWQPQHFVYELRESTVAENWVLRSHGRVLGYACTWRFEDELKINNVAVDPELRGRGLARELLARLLARAGTHGCVRATLEVREGNAAAIALYRSLGFEVVGRRPGYYAREREDALLMELPVGAD